MIEVEKLRLLGTQVLGFTLGRGTGEDKDEWWRGYRDGRCDRADAEVDEAQEFDSTDYLSCPGHRRRAAEEADVLLATPNFALDPRALREPLHRKFALIAVLLDNPSSEGGSRLRRRLGRMPRKAIQCGDGAKAWQRADRRLPGLSAGVDAIVIDPDTPRLSTP